MQQLKVWVLAALIGAGVGGFAVMNTVERQAGAAEDRREAKDYWRHHEGKWSRWSADDKRWYYTDGNHWYYHDGSAWQVYRFDKKFGREGFERGEYKVPGERVKIVLPRHEVFRHR
jgi:hypothetical protein